MKFDLGSLIDSASIDGWDVLFVLLILLASWPLSRYASRAVVRLAGRVQGLSDDLRLLAGRAARYLVWVLGGGLALEVLGAHTRPLLTVALLVGVVAVLALRGIANNFAAGLVLQTRQPIRLDDEIDALGYVGVVRELNGRSVVIETLDGRTVHVPHGRLLDGPIVNHSTLGARRSQVEVRTTGAAHEPAVTDLVRAAVEQTDGVLPSPDPQVLLASVEPERLTYLVWIWHAPLDGPAVSSAVVQAIGRRLRDGGYQATVICPPPVRQRTTPPAPI